MTLIPAMRKNKSMIMKAIIKAVEDAKLVLKLSALIMIGLKSKNQKPSRKVTNRFGMGIFTSDMKMIQWNTND